MSTNYPSALPRFNKVSPTGILLPADAPEWEGVYAPAIGLIIGADPLPCGAVTWAAAMQAAESAELCGGRASRSLSRAEYAYIIEDDRFDPSVDPRYFRGPYRCEWTSTASAPAGCAWYVDLDYGDSYRNRQANDYRVRAVRPSQSLAIGVGAAL